MAAELLHVDSETPSWPCVHYNPIIFKHHSHFTGTTNLFYKSGIWRVRCYVTGAGGTGKGVLVITLTPFDMHHPTVSGCGE